MVEVNMVRSKHFMLFRAIHQGCPLLPMLYVLALEPFLHKLRVSLVLYGIILSGTTALAIYQQCLFACNKLVKKCRRQMQGPKFTTIDLLAYS